MGAGPIGDHFGIQIEGVDTVEVGLAVFRGVCKVLQAGGQTHWIQMVIHQNVTFVEVHFTGPETVQVIK